MLTPEQEKYLNEERVRLMFARHGKDHPEVQAWVKRHGAVPKAPGAATAGTTVVTVAQKKAKEKNE